MRANSLEMAACREPPQLSCCRCISRIATSATPKRNRMAKLITLITVKGMFSRYRTSAPQIDQTRYRNDGRPCPDSTAPEKQFSRASTAGEPPSAARPRLSPFHSPIAMLNLSSLAFVRIAGFKNERGTQSSELVKPLGYGRFSKLAANFEADPPILGKG